MLLCGIGLYMRDAMILAPLLVDVSLGAVVITRDWNDMLY